MDAVDFLLTAFATDPAWTGTAEIAYALATIAHETAWTFRPIEEYGKGRGKAYGKKDPVTGATYYGRGYVQLTWPENYKKASSELGLGKDLYENPEKALVPSIAFDILTRGMHEGWFTGKKLGDFIHGETADFYNARTIINSHDKASTISGYAKEFRSILTSAELAGDRAPAVPGQPQGELSEDEDTQSTNDQSSEAQSPIIPPPPKIVTAPPAEQTVAKSAGTVVAGIVIPPTIIAVFKAVGELVNQGYINAKEIGDAVISFAVNNTRWFFILLAMFMLVLLANKAFKQITMWIEMWIKARRDLHDVEVKPQ